MITYGVCAGPSGKVERFAGPSIERIKQPEDEAIVLFDQSSIFDAYNEVLRRARRQSSLDAVVLLHDDVELRDDLVREKLCTLFADETIAVGGVIGASGVNSLRWWEYDTRGKVTEDRFGVIDFGAGLHEVDMVDGLFLALSPWAVTNLAFDSRTFRGFHGYDGDICFAARAHGRKVVVAEIDVSHHTQGGYGDRDAFDEADRAFKTKWRLREAPRWRQRLQRAGAVRWIQQDRSLPTAASRPETSEGDAGQ